MWDGQNKMTQEIVEIDVDCIEPNKNQPRETFDEEGIEELIKACGVKNLKIIDPVSQDEFIRTVKEFLAKDEVSVIISRRMCALLAKMKKNAKQ